MAQSSEYISLPEPTKTSEKSLEQLLEQRRSVRAYRKAPLYLAEVGQLLWAAQGISDPRGFRTSPSAGALYPLELYVVAGAVDGLPPAVYHYRPKGHRLVETSEGDRRQALRDAAQIELGLRRFLEAGEFSGFTDTFEDLHGLEQLPGIAVQRLMAEGYGFGAEGDWKTAALVRAMKVMSTGLEGGTSFMEDYTYDLNENVMKVLGAHMLEICPCIADEKPSLEVHPLGIGGKADPARLVFASRPGPAVNTTLVDMGGRMRMIVAELDVTKPDQPMPKLPTACAVWTPRPDFKRGCQAWIEAGGAHHAAFCQAVTAGEWEDFAEMAGLEVIRLGADLDLRALRNELRWNDAAIRLGR